jgi:hypothetical protein
LTRPRLWSDDVGVRRPLAVLLAALMCAALAVLAAPLHAVADAQEPDAPADDGTGGSADEEPDENPQPGAVEQDIIPRPNSGHEPTEAGDRGGALQIVVLVAIVAGLGTIAFLATRDVRRSRARTRGAEPAEPAP